MEVRIVRNIFYYDLEKPGTFSILCWIYRDAGKVFKTHKTKAIPRKLFIMRCKGFQTGCNMKLLHKIKNSFAVGKYRVTCSGICCLFNTSKKWHMKWGCVLCPFDMHVIRKWQIWKIMSACASVGLCIYIYVQQIQLYLHAAEEVWSDGYSVMLWPFWKITDHTTESFSEHILWYMFS